MCRSILVQVVLFTLVLALLPNRVRAGQAADDPRVEHPPTLEPAGPPARAGYEPRLRPGVLPALFALVPGFVLHGSGVFAIGDTDTALKLLTVEGIGLFGMVGGTAVLAWTGATRMFTGVTASVMIMGTGLFLTSMIADLYGAITGGTDASSALELPRVRFFMGYRYVYDVQFEYNSLYRLETRVGLDRWLFGVTGWLALDDGNQRARVSTAFRPYGPITGEVDAADGSYVEVTAAGTYHQYLTEGFLTLTGEAMVSGRYDLSRLGPSLRGSFVEASLGYGLEFYDYDVPGLSLGEDTNDMLLGGFAWGFYLGEPRSGHGEVILYYDHRRDDYTGGAGSGFAGHFGLGGHWIFCPDEDGDGFGVRAEAEIGTAFYGGVDLFYQWGAK